MYIHIYVCTHKYYQEEESDGEKRARDVYARAIHEQVHAHTHTHTHTHTHIRITYIGGTNTIVDLTILH